ncbi:hypothetical protein ACFTY8_48170, partial [Streptomyces mirabilis]
MSDDFKRVESHVCPMSTCAAPAGSPCRTGKGRVAIQYHTARFRPQDQQLAAFGLTSEATAISSDAALRSGCTSEVLSLIDAGQGRSV